MKSRIDWRRDYRLVLALHPCLCCLEFAFTCVLCTSVGMCDKFYVFTVEPFSRPERLVCLNMELLTLYCRLAALSQGAALHLFLLTLHDSNQKTFLKKSAKLKLLSTSKSH